MQGLALSAVLPQLLQGSAGLLGSSVGGTPALSLLLLLSPMLLRLHLQAERQAALIYTVQQQ